MAETVKKSRIVSDDEENLEEALLEEFNMRLKNCMSKDDLQNTYEQQPEDDSVYENVTSSPIAISKNGIASLNFIESERQHHYDTCIPASIIENGSTKGTNTNGHDDEIEKENIYETLPEHQPEKTDADQYVDMSMPANRPDLLTLDSSPEIKIEQISHADCEYVDDTDVLESSYEIVEHEDTEKPTFSLNTIDLSDSCIQEEKTKSSVKDRMFLATDDAAATLLFTQTVTSPMLTPSEENIDFLKGFQRDVPSASNSSSEPSPKDLEKTSEDNSTSESEKNIEISKSISETIYENLKDPHAHENIYENLKNNGELDGLEDMEEHIYQDIEDCKKENPYEEVNDLENHTIVPDDLMVENSLYNNLDDLEPQNTDLVTDLDVSENNVEPDKIYETITKNQEEHYDFVANHTDKLENFSEVVENNLILESRFEVSEMSERHFETKEETIQSNTTALRSNTLENNENTIKESYSELIHHSKMESNYYEKYAETISKNSKNLEITNREKDTETVPAEIVKNLKSQFSKNTTEVIATPKKEVIGDVGDLKRINIMKQINKFEQKDCGDGVQAEDSMVTESYTETTMIQSDSPIDKTFKKKKTKKSRKEEKENISVNNVTNGDSVYNVSVKNLCRSFGDLSQIPEDKQNGDQNRVGRAKSLSEVLLSSNTTVIENVFSEVSVRALKEKFNIVENKNPLGIVKTPFKSSSVKSSFSKFDALQKKNVLHIRSSDSEKAQEKFNDAQQMDVNNCKACLKQVFQMEQIKAEKAVWHKNCFRCTECNKQLTVETYVSHEGNLYCKPHFKSLFAPKVVDEDTTLRKSRKPELIIRENQPVELPPDVVRASDKPDLGLEDLQNLNVKERFQVFEHHQTLETQEFERGPTPVNVKRSPSILSKLAKFHAKGMDVGVSDDALNGIPIEETTSEEEEEEEEVPDGEDPTLYRAKRVQKEKPFHFTNLSEVKNKWEQGEHNSREERRQERKEEIQSIRNKLFLGKQGKMKEAYQQAVMQSESSPNIHKSEKIESCDTKSLKERFEKGELQNEREEQKTEDEENEVYQSEISKKSRSLFLELDANASKPPQISPVIPQKLDVKKARETGTPEREIYHDPDVVRAEDYVDDSIIAKTTHTASKMLNKFRQMEENLAREPEPSGPKPLKRFTPPPEPARREASSEEESGSEEEEESEGDDQPDNQKLPQDLIEAQKAARAKQLRAKFEKWEAEEIKREQQMTVNVVEEYGEESQVESAKSLKAHFESLRDSETARTPSRAVKVNRFV